MLPYDYKTRHDSTWDGKYLSVKTDLHFTTKEEGEPTKHDEKTNTGVPGVLCDAIDERNMFGTERSPGNNGMCSAVVTCKELSIGNETLNEEPSSHASVTENTGSVDSEERKLTDALNNPVHAKTNAEAIKVIESPHTVSEEAAHIELQVKKKGLMFFENFSDYFKDIFEKIWERRKRESRRKLIKRRIMPASGIWKPSKKIVNVDVYVLQKGSAMSEGSKTSDHQMDKPTHKESQEVETKESENVALSTKEKVPSMEQKELSYTETSHKEKKSKKVKRKSKDRKRKRPVTMKFKKKESRKKKKADKNGDDTDEERKVCVDVTGYKTGKGTGKKKKSKKNKSDDELNEEDLADSTEKKCKELLACSGESSTKKVNHNRETDDPAPGSETERKSLIEEERLSTEDTQVEKDTILTVTNTSKCNENMTESKDEVNAGVDEITHEKRRKVQRNKGENQTAEEKMEKERIRGMLSKKGTMESDERHLVQCTETTRTKKEPEEQIQRKTAKKKREGKKGEIDESGGPFKNKDKMDVDGNEELHKKEITKTQTEKWTNEDIKENWRVQKDTAEDLVMTKNNQELLVCKEVEASAKPNTRSSEEGVGGKPASGRDDIHSSPASTVAGKKRRFSISFGTTQPAKKGRFSPQGLPVTSSANRRHSWQPYMPMCAICKTTDHVTNDPMCPAYDHNPALRICFKGPLCCMSNMYPCKLVYCGITFPSSEHVYQWKRAVDIGSVDVAGKILYAVDGFAAKRLSNEMDKGKVTEWKENNSIKVMKSIIKEKYLQVEEFRQACIESKDAFLMEATYDRFWGVGLLEDAARSCKLEYLPGKNVLGWIIMQVRNEDIQGMANQLHDLYKGKSSEKRSTFLQGIGHVFDERTHFDQGGRRRLSFTIRGRSTSASSTRFSSQPGRYNFTQFTDYSHTNVGLAPQECEPESAVYIQSGASALQNSLMLMHGKTASLVEHRSISTAEGTGVGLLGNMMHATPSDFGTITPKIEVAHVPDNLPICSERTGLSAWLELLSPRRTDVITPPWEQTAEPRVQEIGIDNVEKHEILEEKTNGLLLSHLNDQFYDSVYPTDKGQLQYSIKLGEGESSHIETGALDMVQSYPSSSAEEQGNSDEVESGTLGNMLRSVTKQESVREPQRQGDGTKGNESSGSSKLPVGLV